jgi:hypothetical protein
MRISHVKNNSTDIDHTFDYNESFGLGDMYSIFSHKRGTQVKIYRLYLLFYVLGLIILFTGCGLPQIKPTLKVGSQETTDIKPEIGVVKDNTTEAAVIKDNTITANSKLMAEISALKATMQGFNTTQKAGGDINSTKLMIYIFSGLFTLISSIFGLFKWQGKMYQKIISGQQVWIENLEKRNSDKAEKLDNWQNKFIEKLADRK